MHMLGDLTGRTLLVFPKKTVMRLAELMLRRPAGSSVALGEMEQSAIKEAGNILSGAYMNALSDFMGMVLLPSPPVLAIDMCDRRADARVPRQFGRAGATSSSSRPSS